MNTDNLSAEHLVEAAIRASLQFPQSAEYVAWAERWLSGEDRSLMAADAAAAEADAAAEAADAAAWAEAAWEEWAEAWAKEAAERSLQLSREAGVDVDAILEEIRGRA
jgi:anthranilate phosphoribosyltransferase